MAVRITTSPNRMELLKLRRRLAIARRGHKLLKDKFDELMKPFLARVKGIRDLRDEVERELCQAQQIFALARSEVSSGEIEAALAEPGASLSVESSVENLVSVRAPRLELTLEGELDCYGLALTPSQLDEAIASFAAVLPKMVRLAQDESTLKLLASEIEKTRRRVNALEYVLIPQLEETIRYITIRLDEFERASRTRLMKIKEMVS
jgi:V/A-type H+-transporting ATPase subunit D